jgi:hypothetical protein
MFVEPFPKFLFFFAGRLFNRFPADSAQTALERVIAAVGQCLDRQSAESLLRRLADTEMQGRIEELADKCTEGRLTSECSIYKQT